MYCNFTLILCKNTRKMAIANGTCVSFCTFSPPLYDPGTIAVNVTWMERGFNAGQRHCSIYTSIFNRLRAIARYIFIFILFLFFLCVYNLYDFHNKINWSEIATFSYPPLHLTPPLGCSHWNSGKKFGPQKTRIMGLPGSEDSLTIGWAVSTCDEQTDGRTDRQRRPPAYSYPWDNRGKCHTVGKRIQCL